MQPLVVMEGVDKSFPGVQALRAARIELFPGEVHALMGENGAGKSTLMKVLAGAYRPDAGTITLDGKPVRIASPADARDLGIAVIYQEFNLVSTLSARENIFLGRETTRAGFVSARRERLEARALFDRIGVRVDPEASVSELTIAQQQLVEIAKAMSQRARVVVMDEPTAALAPHEAERLFAVVREMTSRGVAVVYISHRLDEVFALARRVTVMRDGRHVRTAPVGEVTRKGLIEMMVGRALTDEFPPREPAAGRIGPPRLVVSGLRGGTAVRDVSFSVRRGEVLGLTGLVGAGRTEVARLIFGADRRDAGTISLDGRELAVRSPSDAIRSGICLLTEDRKGQGLVLGLSIRENFGLPNLPALSRFGFVRAGRERSAFDGFVRSLRIRAPGPEEPAGNLSGGNQQKVVLAKWLQANSEVVLFDEPTRGIDVGAKYEIYQLIRRLSADGKAVVMISSELPEVLGMSDRILVMHEGRLSGEVTDVPSATQEEILSMAVG